MRDWTVSNGRFYIVDHGPPGRIRVVSRAIDGGSTRREIDVEGSFDNSLAVDPVSGDIVFGVAAESDYDIAVMSFQRR